jgi:hypothetical protein
MAAEDSLRRIEERLTRLEAALAQQPAGPGGFTPPGGVVVDPAPWGGGSWVFHPRPIPTPVVDPAPWWSGGWGHPRWISDPAPWPTPVVDPAPSVGFAQFRQPISTTFGRIGQIGDPAPMDISRLTISQLESSLHTINAEKARLDSMETMIQQQLDRLRQQG